MAMTVAIVLDTRKVKKGDIYPVKLRVTLKGKQEYYPTIYDLSKLDYNKLSAKHVNEERQKLKAILRETERNAVAFAENINPFCFKLFEKGFITPNPIFKERKRHAKQLPSKESEIIVDYPSSPKEEFDLTPFRKRFKILFDESPEDHILSVYKEYILNLLKERRIGNALSFRDSYLSLKTFRGNAPFTSITKDYLNSYEYWMTQIKGNSRATVGIKLRPLRAIFKKAIAKEIISEKLYPFGREGYRIPTAKKAKKALEQEDIERLFNYQPESESIKRAKAYWFFCYFGNGMNPRDFAYLKYKDIDDDYLYFIRAKTEQSTKEDPILITVYINDEMRKTIDKYGNKDRSPNNFIFPIIDTSQNILQQYDSVKVLAKFIADGMAFIASEIALTKKTNNMVGRHSYATHTKQAGASTEYIKETLGHASLTTTETYLGDYKKQVKKEFSGKLLAFTKKKDENEQTETSQNLKAS